MLVGKGWMETVGKGWLERVGRGWEDLGRVGAGLKGSQKG